jgi:UTP-glucose-1-phosphate uridylyltransferase
MKPTLVLLAAGIGSRYGGLKQVDGIGPSGETIMDYSIYDAIRAGFGKVVFIIRKDIEADFRAAFTNKLEGKLDFEFAYQELDSLPAGSEIPEGRKKPWGTGHAVMVAKNIVDTPFAVINADDYYGADAFQQMAAFLKDRTANETSYSMVGYDLENTLSDFGSVSRGICATDQESYLQSVTERTRIERSGDRIVYYENEQAADLPGSVPVSMNFWGFTPAFFAQLDSLFETFLNTLGDPLKSEFYLSSAIDHLIRTGQATVRVLPTSSKWFGVTYREDKPFVVEKITRLTDSGIYPVNLWE